MFDRDAELAENGEILAYDGRLPVRIKSGSIQDDHIHIETSKESEDISFADIDYICLGIIEEKFTSSEPPKSKMRTMVNGLLGGARGGKETKIRPESRMINILDIYTKGNDVPYRIDASAINYKGFIDKIGYISRDNFRNLLKSICIKASDSKFSASLISFMLKMREKPIVFSSLDDFILSSRKERAESSKNYNWGDVDFESMQASEHPDYDEDGDESAGEG